MADLTDLSKSEAIAKLQYAKNLVKKGKEKAAAGMTIVKTAVETTGTALLLGYWAGSTEADNPDFEMYNLPIDLTIGFGLHGLAFFGLAKSADEDLHAVANGALACYGVRMGLEMGREQASGSVDKSTEADKSAATQGYGVGANRFARRRQAVNPFDRVWQNAA